MGYSEALVEIAKLALRDGVAPVTGIWERMIDRHWTIVLNGGKETVKYGAVPIPPYTAYIIYNGWPAGFVDAHGGVIARGAAANEDTFIAAVQAAAALTEPPEA